MFVNMKKSIERLWQRWGDTVKFLLWGLTVALVCFLLYKVTMNHSNSHLVSLSEGGRDSLMTVGIPNGMNDTLVNYGEAFTVHFNSGRGIANCAVYELVSNELNGTVERMGEFMTDAGVKGCPSPQDYAGCGMDRGHLVPAGDLKWSEEAMRQSFLLTNALLVFTGPVVSDGDTTLQQGRVTVPGAYYKIIMAPCVRPVRAIAFIYPNGHSGGRLRQYAVSVDEVERRTGLDFFPTLPTDEQQRLESTANLDAWIK